MPKFAEGILRTINSQETTPIFEPINLGTKTPSKPALQLDHIDGIRGLLTLAILFAHVRTMFIWIPVHPSNFAAIANLTVWTWPAFYTVGMFVAISGYCLMIPVVLSKDRWFRGGTNDYLWRRARRIVPPFYTALILYVIIIQLMPANHYLASGKNWSHGSLITHALLIYNLFPSYRTSINGPTWTVGTEWQLYLLFPFVLLPVWKRFGIPALLFVSATLSLLPVLHGGDMLNYHSWYILVFALGMCGAVVQYSTHLPENRWRTTVHWSRVAFISSAAFGLLCIIDITLHTSLIQILVPDWKRFLVYEVLSGSACVALMVYCGQIQASSTEKQSSTVMKFLTQPWLAFIGMFSYSHYLMHWPVLLSIRWLTQIMKLPDAYVVLIMFFIAIPTSLGVGYIFFLLVERRFLPSHLRSSVAGRDNLFKNSR